MCRVMLGQNSFNRNSEKTSVHTVFAILTMRDNMIFVQSALFLGQGSFLQCQSSLLYALRVID